MIPVRLVSADLSDVHADLAACFAYEGEEHPRGVRDGVLRRLLRAEMQEQKFSGRRGDLLVPRVGDRYPSKRMIVVGLGKAGAEPSAATREGSARAVRAAERFGARSVALRLPPSEGDGSATQVRAAVEGALLGAYRFDRYLTDPSRRGTVLERLHLVAEGPKRELNRAAGLGEIAASSVCLARDLVNEAPSSMTPEALARRAAREARAAGLTVKVWGPAAIRKLGMGALLAVARGSDQEPRVVHLVYRPKRGRPAGRVALVGKGVTFDSGGLNIKTTQGMSSMKADMAGAAAVLAVMTSLSRTACRLEVHGLLGLVENMTGPGAFKPGDILRTFSGKTVEVTNTDAEGRLVLCDLLAYAATRIKPDRMVDVATLTGACVVALGSLGAGLFSRDETVRNELLHAAARAGEKLWPMPMYEEYLEQLQKGPADLRNCGERWGGAITAALFLGEFVPRDLPWVHLDIAGPAYLDHDTPEAAAGATGAGVRTLLRWLE